MPDKNNKEKSLTQAEKKRAERFAKISADMEQQGYTRHDLTIDIGKANLFTIVLLIPLLIIGYGLFYLIHHSFRFSAINMMVDLILFLVLIVVHELIHGISWSIFTPNHFKDIEFGVLMSSLTPYCACLVPLDKKHYIFGTAMPLIVLGIIPMIVGIIIGSLSMLFLGILMTVSAGGDILIIRNLLQYKTNADDIVYMDHPTEAGGVIFER